MSDPTVLTPYSTVSPFFTEEPLWVPELERERIAAYETYERIYWSVPHAFKITMRGTDDQPVYVPSGRTVVNETSHYLLKGLTISPPEGMNPSDPFAVALRKFLKRERFYAKFQTAKQSGVTRGDYVFHITADPEKPEGRRISINSIDPAMYFPIYDPDDIDRIIGVDIVEQYEDPTDNKMRIKRLRYTYVDPEKEGLDRQVMREEAIMEVEGWWDGKAAKVKQQIMKPEVLPSPISQIPVYHFKNIDWQGEPFGRSELAGFEMLMSSVNQTISDEELALALEGLGVYATDAPAPTDDDGNEEDWVITPGYVAEVPTGSYFKRVEGVGSVTPMQDHVGFLLDSLYEASGTFRSGAVDVQLAESGIALAIKFMPTMAKLEQRDLAGLAVLENMFFDWKFFHAAYEKEDFTDEDRYELIIAIGDKLPTNRTERVNELNNMLDRQVIDREYYRTEMKKLGYVFPDNIGERVVKEQEELTKARMFESPVNGQGPNNQRRPNESGGTEANDAEDQQ